MVNYEIENWSEIVKYNLIPFYREKEHYTLFYDYENSLIYKIQHRKKSFSVFYLVILGILFSSSFLDSIYQAYKGTITNIILFLASIIISYFIAKLVYDNYYLQDTKRKILLDDNYLKDCAIKGVKQFKIESYACIFVFIIAILCFVLFFSINRIQPLIIGCLGLSAIFVLIFMNPFRRVKVLREFVSNEITLK